MKRLSLIIFAALSLQWFLVYADEQPKMEFVKKIPQDYLGSYFKIGGSRAEPECQIKENGIKLKGLGDYKMVSLIHVFPREGKDYYSVYLDDAEETWLVLRKLTVDTLEIQFREKATQRVIKSDSYQRFSGSEGIKKSPEKP
jgi:hypothetical protein